MLRSFWLLFSLVKFCLELHLQTVEDSSTFSLDTFQVKVAPIATQDSMPSLAAASSERLSTSSATHDTTSSVRIVLPKSAMRPSSEGMFDERIPKLPPKKVRCRFPEIIGYCHKIMLKEKEVTISATKLFWKCFRHKVRIINLIFGCKIS